VKVAIYSFSRNPTKRFSQSGIQLEVRKLALVGPRAMTDLSQYCDSKRTSASVAVRRAVILRPATARQRETAAKPIRPLPPIGDASPPGLRTQRALTLPDLLP
jgi:hypothetical protein